MLNFPSFTSGDTLTFCTKYSGLRWDGLFCTSDLYNLSFTIANGTTIVSFSSVAVGLDWATTIAPPATNIPDGLYGWQAVLTSIAALTNSKVIGRGQVKVLPNLATITTPYDPRTQYEITLANIRTAIQTLTAGGAVEEYRIEGRLRRNTGLADLRKLESQYVMLVEQEKNLDRMKNGLPASIISI